VDAKALTDASREALPVRLDEFVATIEASEFYFHCPNSKLNHARPSSSLRDPHTFKRYACGKDGKEHNIHAKRQSTFARRGNG